MKLLIKITIFALFLSNPIFGQDTKKQIDKTIFVYGGDFNKSFINYVVGLTKKTNPKVLFVPTGAADSSNYINYWYSSCAELPLIPYVLRTFINSSPEQKTFEEQILECDAIIVGGGNTLNMLAIWKAQGIDIALKKAYEKGIILAGGSAGSLCWFTSGSTDSRPKELSFVEGLSFLNYSHCPHYHSEATRKPLYHSAILTGKLKQGYACDDKAGLLFINGIVKKSLSQDIDNNNYFVSIVDGKIKEELLPAEIIKE
jgi:dipeptidase E